MFYQYILLIFLMLVANISAWAELDPVYIELNPSETVTEVLEKLTVLSEEDEDMVATDATELFNIIGSNIIKDIVLVLDNSGSMRKNDPQFLTKHAVVEFINNLDEVTRASIIIFDQNVNTVVPLTEVSLSRQSLLDSLVQIDYKGLYTNSPAAIESAIYDLKNNAREGARKVIIFMTDGIVDTGNADRDLEKTKWLKGDLAEDAADAGIKIFGIAFTENADFELIQSLAQKTDGEYYRALLADDLQKTFRKLNSLINRPDEPEVIEPPETIIIEKIIEKIIEPVQPVKPIIIEAPIQPQVVENSEQKHSILILIVLAALILTVIIIVLILLRGGRSKSPDKEIVPEAYLNDIHSITNQKNVALGKKPTMLGRVAGKDIDSLNYFVIPETTIGRRHSLIEYEDFGYWIVDQGSINGTFVNNQMVTSKVRLKHGDMVKLHKFEFVFVMPEMEDFGMTVISDAVISDGVMSDDETVILDPNATTDQTDSKEFNFDITGGSNDDGFNDGSDDETMLTDLNSSSEANSDDESSKDLDDDPTISPKETLNNTST